jgi:hypothetical protein
MMEATMSNQQSQPYQAQNLIILFEAMSTREMSDLVDAWSGKLQAENVPTVTLTYGILTKSSLSIIAFECYQPVPRVILEALHNDTSIIGFMVYDVASLALQELHIMQPYSGSHDQDLPSVMRTDTPTTEPPTDYVLISKPQPLLSPYDERWIGRALGPDGVGILIYEHQRAICFFTADEAATVLSVLRSEDQNLRRYQKHTTTGDENHE